MILLVSQYIEYEFYSYI